MRTILLTVSYDGTDFCGWQKQTCANGSVPHMRTVQEELEKALAVVHKVPVQACGSGRTDSGVHAYGQAVTFESPIDSIPAENYVPALNCRLPPDLRVMSAKEVPMGFHARFNATRRTYRYFIWCGSNPPAHKMRYIWPIFYRPDLEKLNRLCAPLHGELDCTTFSAASDESPSKCRYIEEAFFYQNPDEPDEIIFQISANAFLWRMVRSITGTLIQAEKKGVEDDYIGKILEAKDRKLAGLTAPPQGLFLWNVGFEGIRRGPK